MEKDAIKGKAVGGTVQKHLGRAGRGSSQVLKYTFKCIFVCCWNSDLITVTSFNKHLLVFA